MANGSAHSQKPDRISRQQVTNDDMFRWVEEAEIA